MSTQGLIFTKELEKLNGLFLSSIIIRLRVFLSNLSVKFSIYSNCYDVIYI